MLILTYFGIALLILGFLTHLDLGYSRKSRLSVPKTRYPISKSSSLGISQTIITVFFLDNLGYAALLIALTQPKPSAGGVIAHGNGVKHPCAWILHALQRSERSPAHRSSGKTTTNRCGRWLPAASSTVVIEDVETVRFCAACCAGNAASHTGPVNKLVFVR